MRTGFSAALVGVGLVAASVVLTADTLVLRDGRQVRGDLISVQRGIVEFRELGGGDREGGRTIQVRLDEVRRIEIDEGRGPGEPSDRYPPRDVQEGRQGRPSGLGERDVWVSATAAWTDSGIDVRPGQVVYFDTHGGDIEWRRGEKTRADGNPDARSNGARPMPNRGIGALIGKIGQSSRDYFFVGEKPDGIRMRDGGRLMLGINDENLADNRGAFRVTVYY